MKYNSFENLRFWGRSPRIHSVIQGLRKLFPEEIVNQASSYFPEEDLIENLAKKYGLESHEVLEQVAKLSGLHFLTKVPTPTIGDLENWKASSNELRSLHLTPSNRDQKQAIICANPATIDVQKFRKQGFEIFLALGSEIRRAWNEFDTLRSFQEKATEQDLQLALESIISEVAGLGVKKIALGYPEGDSFQYRSKEQTLQGSIHPKLVFLANQLLFDQRQLSFSFAKVSAEIVHETIKGQTLLVANLTPELEETSKQDLHQFEDQKENRSVVLVDDQRGFLKVLGKFMERKGWSVTSFSSSAEALAYLGNNDSTDLLICDYHIDTMDGLELVDKVKEVLPNLPVVILSGDCRPEVKETLVQSGVSAFVQKQEDPRVLMAWCNTLIEQKENESRH